MVQCIFANQNNFLFILLSVKYSATAAKNKNDSTLKTNAQGSATCLMGYNELQKTSKIQNNGRYGTAEELLINTIKQINN